MSTENKKPKKFRFFCEKLARDKNPARALAQGGKNHGRVLSPHEFRRELRKKLIEEAEEVAFAETKDELISEIIDLEQVIAHIVAENNISREELAEKREYITELRGSFSQRFYSNFVEAEEGSWLANHCLNQPSRYTQMPDFNQQVELEDHCSSWEERFVLTQQHISEKLGNEIVALHHIGSTAVKGLSAKPIIDILIEVRDLLSFDLKKYRLEELGFTSYGEFGIIGRRFFVKLDHTGAHLVHLHCFEQGDPQIVSHLTFKKILLESQRIKTDYEELKRDLAQKHKDDRKAYNKEKGSFIKDILAKK